MISAPQLKAYIEGTVNAVILYCLPVYANSWGVGDEGRGDHKSLFTKEDMRRIQTLQNKAMRCLVKRQEDIPWETLGHMGASTLSRKTGIQMTVL